MPDESSQSAPASSEKKHKLTPAMEAKIIKPGEVRNPLGRPAGVKSVRSKLLSKYSQLWGRADAPDDWIGDSLKLMKKKGLTIDELIVIRVKYCLATNTKYQNPALLKEIMDRAEGKIPLRVLTKPGEDGDLDELDALTDEELKAYVESIDRRAKLAAVREEAIKAAEPAQLPENVPLQEPHAGDSEVN
jgi:hypothetical protein